MQFNIILKRAEMWPHICHTETINISIILFFFTKKICSLHHYWTLRWLNHETHLQTRAFINVFSHCNTYFQQFYVTVTKNIINSSEKSVAEAFNSIKCYLRHLSTTNPLHKPNGLNKQKVVKKFVCLVVAQFILLVVCSHSPTFTNHGSKNEYCRSNW